MHWKIFNKLLFLKTSFKKNTYSSIPSLSLDKLPKCRVGCLLISIKWKYIIAYFNCHFNYRVSWCSVIHFASLGRIVKRQFIYFNELTSHIEVKWVNFIYIAVDEVCLNFQLQCYSLTLNRPTKFLFFFLKILIICWIFFFNEISLFFQRFLLFVEFFYSSNLSERN